ncbi:uncharacterized protein BDZ99DRAFT_527969 [Mytilinidion resinicola]|uniref:Uncharacterized protein n=1 Tax=Mytilinidion resinicola TaxID=574789 RepID=A0A6A6Y0H8_9PEZI|nr:uncharacterized protein BDZ99DRAFT_527969 [Mytilinidion resinicola]KAF2802023.1 hypothetical protein BDZ99DRAFT_527969 [Mytilinidion resinicola]
MAAQSRCEFQCRRAGCEAGRRLRAGSQVVQTPLHGIRAARLRVQKRQAAAISKQDPGRAMRPKQLQQQSRERSVGLDDGYARRRPAPLKAVVARIGVSPAGERMLGTVVSGGAGGVALVAGFHPGGMLGPLETRWRHAGGHAATVRQQFDKQHSQLACSHSPAIASRDLGMSLSSHQHQAQLPHGLPQPQTSAALPPTLTSEAHRDSRPASSACRRGVLLDVRGPAEVTTAGTAASTTSSESPSAHGAATRFDAAGDSRWVASCLVAVSRLDDCCAPGEGARWRMRRCGAGSDPCAQIGRNSAVASLAPSLVVGGSGCCSGVARADACRSRRGAFGRHGRRDGEANGAVVWTATTYHYSCYWRQVCGSVAVCSGSGGINVAAWEAVPQQTTVTVPVERLACASQPTASSFGTSSPALHSHWGWLHGRLAMGGVLGMGIYEWYEIRLAPSRGISELAGLRLAQQWTSTS